MHRLDAMKRNLQHKDEVLLEEKKKRREVVAVEVAKRKELEKKSELTEFVDELRNDLITAEHHARAARKQAKLAWTKQSQHESCSKKRLALLKSLKVQLNKAQDDLADESHQHEAIKRM